MAIITGAASGIGASAAQLFHKNGAKVVIADVQGNLGEALADKLGRQDVCYIHCDVSNEGEVINLVDTTVAKFGKLDIMVNSACNLEYRSFVSILDTPKSDLERVLAVNTIGGFLVAKHAARVMVPRRGGCILYTTGTGTNACTETERLCNIPANYGVSKFGILGLVKSLAAELGQYGIRVDCVSPTYGLAMTEAIASIANAAFYNMATDDDTSYVGEQNLVVNGGFR